MTKILAEAVHGFESPDAQGNGGALAPVSVGRARQHSPPRCEAHLAPGAGDAAGPGVLPSASTHIQDAADHLEAAGFPSMARHLRRDGAGRDAEKLRRDLDGWTFYLSGLVDAAERWAEAEDVEHLHAAYDAVEAELDAEERRLRDAG